MTRLQLLFCFLSSVLLFAGCEIEEPAEVNNLYIAAELQPYFDLFEVEAAARGLDYNLSEENLEGYLLRIADDDVIGQCAFNTEQPRRVTIDVTFWRRASDFEKEMVVFHELGHCVLDRDHVDDANPDGTCVSIMHSGLGDCRLNYNGTNKEGYLDELFRE